MKPAKQGSLETSQSGSIQVLISTVAFGMGTNLPDVDIVIHWGLPNSS